VSDQFVEAIRHLATSGAIEWLFVPPDQKIETDSPIAMHGRVRRVSPRRDPSSRRVSREPSRNRSLSPARLEFAWYTPALDGRPRAYHCAELPFVFNNAERTNASAAGGEDAVRLAHRMSDAWTAFARTGNPNHSQIPRWEPTSSAAWPTMVFNSELSVRDDRKSPELLVLEATEREA
jgi:para-nitrobenzyl esterase